MHLVLKKMTATGRKLTLLTVPDTCTHMLLCVCYFIQERACERLASLFALGPCVLQWLLQNWYNVVQGFRCIFFKGIRKSKWMNLTCVTSTSHACISTPKISTSICSGSSWLLSWAEQNHFTHTGSDSIEMSWSQNNWCVMWFRSVLSGPVRLHDAYRSRNNDLMPFWWKWVSNF